MPTSTEVTGQTKPESIESTTSAATSSAVATSIAAAATPAASISSAPHLGPVKPTEIKTQSDLLKALEYVHKIRYPKVLPSATSLSATSLVTARPLSNSAVTAFGVPGPRAVGNSGATPFSSNATTPTSQPILIESPINLSELVPLPKESDLASWPSPIPLAALTNKFLGADHSFAILMNKLDHFLRTTYDAATGAALAHQSGASIAPPQHSTAVIETAKLILNTIQTMSQLAGWEHVASYIENAQLYIDRSKTASLNRSASLNAGNPFIIPDAVRSGIIDNTRSAAQAAPAATQPSPIIALAPIMQMSDLGEQIFKKLVYRLNWFNELCEANKENFDSAIAVEMMSIDKTWCDEATQFIKDSEARVTALLEKYPQKFNGFRGLQKKGVQWPHSAQLRRDIEKAAFVYRPMMIKRDRCVCDACGVEVSGWRAWHEPRQFHNYSKHPASFRDEQFPKTASTSSAATVSTATNAGSLDMKSNKIW